MIKKIFIVLMVCFFPTLAHAVTYDDILEHKANSSKPYWGDYYQYKNIKWISHQPYFEGATDEQMKELEKAAIEEVDDRGQIDVGSVDFNSDGKAVYLRVIWTAYGGPAKGLVIEAYQDKALKNRIATVSPQNEGYHPNFKVEDVDSDGKLELITFAGVPDPNMSGMVEDKKPFEPRFADRFLRVSIYKYKDGTLKLSRQYLTKVKYEPHYVPVDKGLPK